MAETKARIRLKRDSEQNWDRASTVEKSDDSFENIKIIDISY